MKSLLGISLFMLFLSFGLLNGLKAQEKYEYAIVAYHPPHPNTIHKGLYISISGKEFEEIEVKKDQVKHVIGDFTILLNYVQGMTEKGWRVINSYSVAFGASNPTTFVLERKTTN
jgi:hypothetical protein